MVAVRHHYRSYQHMHMLLKMTFFQIFNTSVSVLAFLFLTWDVDSNTACPLSSPSSGRARPAFACTHMRLGGPGLLEIDVDALCVSHWRSRRLQAGQLCLGCVSDQARRR